eukprot:3179769-Prymnesium_polylepis.1
MSIRMGESVAARITSRGSRVCPRRADRPRRSTGHGGPRHLYLIGRSGRRTCRQGVRRLHGL